MTSINFILNLCIRQSISMTGSTRLIYCFDFKLIHEDNFLWYLYNKNHNYDNEYVINNRCSIFSVPKSSG